MNKITIFTPTYNREETLPKLYDSIKSQKYKNFEWIIVDDGSIDNTQKIIKQWINENKVEIKYFYQKNSGKHIAINKGVNEATGNLFFIVDSDDYLTPNALNIINNWEKTINKNNKYYAGISGLKIHENGKIIGTTFKNEEYVDATSLERRKYKILGDKAEIFYTNILKKYKFPKIEGENFISEAYIWNKIATNGYKIRWFNEPLVICEYRADGLSKNKGKISEKNPKGQLLYLKELIKYEKNYIRKIAHYSTYVKIAKKIYSNKEIKKQLNINLLELNILLFISKIRGK